MERCDVAVIGTGPAGASAAITAKLRGKIVTLFGSASMSEKMTRAHLIQNYPGLPSVSGAELARALAGHLKSMDIPITEKRVNAVYAMDGYFALQCGEEFIEARSVIIAAGVMREKPLPGENELLGSGVSHCATCDASLYRGKNVAVIGYDPGEEAEAAFLSEVCAHVTYIPAYKDDTRLPEKVVVVREKPEEIGKDEDGVFVKTDKGTYRASGIFVLRESVAPSQLVPGIETAGNHINVNRKMETNIPGVFACGDVTGTPYQYIKAAGEGNVAALSAVAYLDKNA